MIIESYLTLLQEAGEQSFQMYKKYGTVALLTVAPSVIYNYIFRQVHKTCTKGCKSFQTDPVCWYACYMRGITVVLAAIGRDEGQANSVPDRNERNKLKLRIQAERDRWQQKEEKMREKLMKAKDELKTKLATRERRSR